MSTKKVLPYKRHPIKNFIIVPGVQWAHVIRMMSMTLLTSITTLVIVAGVYYFKFGSGYFYYLEDQAEGLVIRHNIWNLVLPSALPALFLTVILSAYISLYSSRKIALPIFKIRRWSEALFAGNLRHSVNLRKGDNLNELAHSCNQISRKYSQILKDIDLASKAEIPAPERLLKIQNLLQRIEY